MCTFAHFPTDSSLILFKSAVEQDTWVILTRCDWDALRGSSAMPTQRHMSTVENRQMHGNDRMCDFNFVSVRDASLSGALSRHLCKTTNSSENKIMTEIIHILVFARSLCRFLYFVLCRLVPAQCKEEFWFFLRTWCRSQFFAAYKLHDNFALPHFLYLVSTFFLYALLFHGHSLCGCFLFVCDASIEKRKFGERAYWDIRKFEK